MLLVYNLLVLLALLVVGPVILLVKKKARAGVFEKLGFVPEYVTPKGKRPRIWFHTVSVGEFNASYKLIKQFHDRHAEWEIFVSTTTATGQALAEEKLAGLATIFYFPYDVPWATARWLDRVQPDVVAIAETEMWPSFIHQAHARSVKLTYINARISPRSFKRYQWIKGIIEPTLQCFDLIAAQSEQEALRFRALGAHADVVTTAGNMKLDGIGQLSQQDRQALRQTINILPDDVVIVAGSTHEGEESAVLEAAAAAARQISNVRLVLAPRHPERFQRVSQIIESCGCRVRRHSGGDKLEQPNDIFLLDTIGELSKFYSLATVAFVGGTIAPIGGHNLVEPCAYQVPVVCGPHTEKTRDIALALLERAALVQVAHRDQLPAAIIDLLKSAPKRSTVGKAGRQFLADSQGAVGRTLALLEQCTDTVAAPAVGQRLKHESAGAVR